VTSPPSMQAIVLEAFGDPEVLALTTVARPEAGAGEVRIRVGASSVAFGRDVSVRAGRHPIFRRLVTLPHVLGGEHAGTVDAVGAGVHDALVGARVAVSAPVRCGACGACQRQEPWDCATQTIIGIHHMGSNAEYTVVPASNAHVLPSGMPFTQAAALAASGPLAWEELDIGRVQPGTCVLVPGASGSVGTLIVALAKRRGARVIAATRGRRASAELTVIGADAVLDASDPELVDLLRTLSPRGIDVVIDNIADADLFDRYWPALARRGRVVFAGQAGNHGEPLRVDIGSLYSRRATIAGIAIGDPRPVAAFWTEMRERPLVLSDGMIEAYPLAQAADAHRRIEQGGKVGHVVLRVP
jgi:NADPH:quinone reductase-like Zn-dependent oxidoreductase